MGCVNGIQVNGLPVEPIIGFCSAKEIHKTGGCMQCNWDWAPWAQHSKNAPNRGVQAESTWWIGNNANGTDEAHFHFLCKFLGGVLVKRYVKSKFPWASMIEPKHASLLTCTSQQSLNSTPKRAPNSPSPSWFIASATVADADVSLRSQTLHQSKHQAILSTKLDVNWRDAPCSGQIAPLKGRNLISTS